MLTKNKYLKEVGIDPDNFWLFDKDYVANDKRYQPDEDGFVAAEFYNLDATLILEIYCRLRYFQDNCYWGMPPWFKQKYGETAQKKWDMILKKMIKGFKIAAMEDSRDDIWLLPDERENRHYSKNRKKQINYAFKLFSKYFYYLWY